MNRTITRVYDRYADAEAAVRRLKEAGFSDTQISLIGHQYAKGEPGTDSEVADDAAGGAAVGGALGAGAGLLAGLGLMAIPGIGPVVAAGWLASTAVGAATGAIVGGAAGGLIGAMTETGMSREDAETYAESVRRGGSLVSVRTDEVSEQQASLALDAGSSLDVGSQREAWRRDGWAGFDPDAAPYPRDQMPYGRNGQV
jgi:hypothetical protein